MRYTSKPNKTMEEFLKDMEYRVATTVYDCASDKFRAIVWAIFCGWDDKSYEDLIKDNIIKEGDEKFLRELRMKLYGEET